MIDVVVLVFVQTHSRAVRDGQTETITIAALIVRQDPARDITNKNNYNHCSFLNQKSVVLEL